MKRLLLLLALFGVLATGCEELLPNEQKPVEKPTEQPTEDQIFFTDVEGNYVVCADGGEVLVIIATNLEYSIVIPEKAQSWLSVAETRAGERIDKRTFIVARNDSFEERSTTAELIGTDGEVLQSITFVQSGQTKVFETDSEGNYHVVANGGEVMVAVTTNLEYNIVISEDAEDWLSVADTRVVVREDKLTFVVAVNESFEERSATVELTNNDGEVLQAISFVQDAAIQTELGCPNNEIWYTNGSTTEATTPNNTDAFGANIISNTYDAAKECWVIKFDGKVTTIGNYAFEDCSSLTSVTIPDSVTSIGDYAFTSCRSLTSITIPDSVTSIGSYAFIGCSSLTSVTIPDSVTSIGWVAFHGCSSLTSVYISDIYAWCNISSFESFSNPFNLYLNNELVTDLTIPDSVTKIGDFAFTGCSSLTSVTIPDSVTTIGQKAFEGCSSLTSVYISDISAWCNISFSDPFSNPLSNGCNLYLNNELVTDLTIPDSVTTIGNYSFRGCESLTSVTIPDSVTTIGNDAFLSCSSLQEFKGKFASEDGRYLIVDGVFNSFAIGCGATEYTIPDSVTTIGYCAFCGCSSLTSVTIPDSVTTIGNSAFASCASLTSVTIGDRVTTIGSSTFYNCSSITSVTIPDNVTTIGYWAFRGCSRLTSVYCKPTTPPAVTLNYYYDWGAFDENSSGRKIYVPMESVEAYKSAQGWSRYADVIEGYNF